MPIGQDVPVPRSTRMCGSGQVMAARRSAGVWFSSSDRGFLTLPRFAGVTCTRCLLFGAKTPWKRVRLTLGLGTNATSLEMAVPAHPCAHGIPYILYIISSGSNMTCVVPLRQGVRLKRLLLVQLIADLAIAGQRQTFRRHRRSGDIAAQTF